MDERYDKNTLDRTVKALEELVDNQQEEIMKLQEQLKNLSDLTLRLVKILKERRIL